MAIAYLSLTYDRGIDYSVDKFHIGHICYTD